MPYSAQHKQKTRERIVECARQLFNRHGFSNVSIDEIMEHAGLTRGGFYNHFETKDELFVEAIEAYASCNPADRWEEIELDLCAHGADLAKQIVNAYLSRQHLEDLNGHCPMIALPSDAARATPKVKDAYHATLTRMIAAFEDGVNVDAGAGADAGSNARSPQQQAMAMAALCVGGMVLARTFEDSAFANKLREAARLAVHDVAGWPVSG